jgi:hypothetical protein
MLGGFATLILGLMYIPLSFPFAFGTYMLTSSVVYIAHILAQIPGVIQKFTLPLYVLLVIYTIQLCYLLLSRNALKR